MAVKQTNNRAGDRQGAPGRRADTPSEIPVRGWLAIVKRVGREFTRHDTTLTAAGISFLALFGVFSAIAAFVAFYGLFFDPQTVVANMRAMRGFVPTDVVITMIGQMHAVASGSKPTLISAGTFSLVVAIWCAQQGVAALMIALNTAYRETIPYGPWRHLLKSLVTALCVILGLLLAAILAIALPLASQIVGVSFWAVQFVRVAGMSLAGLCLFFGLAALYRWVPERRPPRWRWVRSGALLVVGFWAVGSVLFSVFLLYSNSYTVMYGSLSAVVILLTLMYVTVVTVLVGAEFNAQVEHQTGQDTTVDEQRPMGQRGATMADTVADETDSKPR